jgi:2-oxoglutarate dehydrogenase E2 component (dihydrolipoamide succinyltransferase)
MLFAHCRTETRIKMSRMRLRIAERLKSAQNTAAMLTTFQETDMSKLIAMRTTYKDEFEKIHGVKVMTDCILSLSCVVE